MKIYRIFLLFGFTILMLTGCGGGGGYGGGSSQDASQPAKLKASISTQITGSVAVSTISISGATAPTIYGFQLTVTCPQAAVFSSASPTGVNSGNLIESNPGAGSVNIGSAGSAGFGSGEVLSVVFTNVPNTAQATDFTVTDFIAKDSNGATIP